MCLEKEMTQNISEPLTEKVEVSSATSSASCSESRNVLTTDNLLNGNSGNSDVNVGSYNEHNRSNHQHNIQPPPLLCRNLSNQRNNLHSINRPYYHQKQNYLQQISHSARQNLTAQQQQQQQQLQQLQQQQLQQLQQQQLQLQLQQLQLQQQQQQVQMQNHVHAHPQQVNALHHIYVKQQQQQLLARLQNQQKTHAIQHGLHQHTLDNTHPYAQNLSHSGQSFPQQYVNLDCNHSQMHPLQIHHGESQPIKSTDSVPLWAISPSNRVVQSAPTTERANGPISSNMVAILDNNAFHNHLIDGRTNNIDPNLYQQSPNQQITLRQCHHQMCLDPHHQQQQQQQQQLQQKPQQAQWWTNEIAPTSQSLQHAIPNNSHDFNHVNGGGVNSKVNGGAVNSFNPMGVQQIGPFQEQVQFYFHRPIENKQQGHYHMLGSNIQHMRLVENQNLDEQKLEQHWIKEKPPPPILCSNQLISAVHPPIQSNQLIVGDRPQNILLNPSQGQQINGGVPSSNQQYVYNENYYDEGPNQAIVNSEGYVNVDQQNKIEHPQPDLTYPIPINSYNHSEATEYGSYNQGVQSINVDLESIPTGIHKSDSYESLPNKYGFSSLSKPRENVLKHYQSVGSANSIKSLSIDGMIESEIPKFQTIDLITESPAMLSASSRKIVNNSEALQALDVIPSDPILPQISKSNISESLKDVNLSRESGLEIIDLGNETSKNILKENNGRQILNLVKKNDTEKPANSGLNSMDFYYSVFTGIPEYSVVRAKYSPEIVNLVIDWATEELYGFSILKYQDKLNCLRNKEADPVKFVEEVKESIRQLQNGLIRFATMGTDNNVQDPYLNEHQQETDQVGAVSVAEFKIPVELVAKDTLKEYSSGRETERTVDLINFEQNYLSNQQRKMLSQFMTKQDLSSSGTQHVESFLSADLKDSMKDNELRNLNVFDLKTTSDQMEDNFKEQKDGEKYDEMNDEMKDELEWKEIEDALTNEKKPESDISTSNNVNIHIDQIVLNMIKDRFDNLDEWDLLEKGDYDKVFGKSSRFHSYPKFLKGYYNVDFNKNIAILEKLGSFYMTIRNEKQTEKYSKLHKTNEILDSIFRYKTYRENNDITRSLQDFAMSTSIYNEQSANEQFKQMLLSIREEFLLNGVTVDLMSTVNNTEIKGRASDSPFVEIEQNPQLVSQLLKDKFSLLENYDLHNWPLPNTNNKQVLKTLKVKVKKSTCSERISNDTKKKDSINVKQSKALSYSAAVSAPVPPDMVDLYPEKAATTFPIKVLNKMSKKQALCTFCKNNDRPADIPMDHTVRDIAGKILCPRLRAYICPFCKATGDNAHTIKYCPQRFQIKKTII